MRRGLSKTFRSNLVEFDTDLGVRYAAPPTLWVRLYLIWTFRNFRSLPKQVFNRHQQRLMDKLIRSSTLTPGIRVDRSSLIGTVEQVRLTPQAIAQLEAAERATPAENGISRPSGALIAGTERQQQEPVAQATPESPDRFESETSIPNSRKPKIKIIVRIKKKTASLVFLGAAALIAVLLLPNRIYISGRHGNPSSTTLAQAAASQRQVQNVAMVAPAAAKTEPLSNLPKPSLAPTQLRPSPNPDAGRQSPEASSGGSSAVHPGPVSLASLLTPTSVLWPAEPTGTPRMDDADTDQTLPRVAGPPQSRMVYPTYPGTEHNGKVVLTAVVGQDGNIKSIAVISGNKIFANAALKAVKQWRYLPYEIAGKPVAFQTTISFDFRGDEVVSVSFPQL